MIGCGDCPRCRSGRHHVCAARREVGIMDGLPGALAERLAVPVAALHELPETVDAVVGALVEPGGNALRCVRATDLAPGEGLLVLGTGTIGLLVAMFARSQGFEVDLLGQDERRLELARALGFERAWTRDALPSGPWHAIVDASNGPALPALAVDLVEPGRRVVYIGLAGTPSLVDTRRIVYADATVVGILGASAGLAGAIDAYADGSVDPRPLVAATVGLDEVASVLSGRRPDGAGPGPKVLVDPRR
jgi:threonine dehydrogenase-like Zn-dependent dehydrogenase